MYTVKRPLAKRPNIGTQDQISLNADKKYYRKRPSTFIKLPFFNKIFGYFGLFLSGRFTQVLLYWIGKNDKLSVTYLRSYRPVSSVG